MEAVGALMSLTHLTILVLDVYWTTFRRALSVTRQYGPDGLLLLAFGSRSTWQVQAQVLGRANDGHALEFRKSVQDECTMISIAAAILAQIAITALSLSSLSQTHWLVRGCCVFSLTSALMAVYYATVQHKTLGRLLTAKQIRTWIRGGIERPAVFSHAPPMYRSLLAMMYQPSWIYGIVPLRKIWTYRYCDAEDLEPGDIKGSSSDQMCNSITRQCFVPGIASVITMSAPQVLLSAALLALLIALGIYLGFTWTYDLDKSAGTNDSRNVFCMYIIGLSVCFIVYSLSELVQCADPRLEDEISSDYMKCYVQTHPGWLANLDIQASYDEKGGLVLTKVVRQDDDSIESTR